MKEIKKEEEVNDEEDEQEEEEAVEGVELSNIGCTITKWLLLGGARAWREREW